MKGCRFNDDISVTIREPSSKTADISALVTALRSSSFTGSVHCSALKFELFTCISLHYILALYSVALVNFVHCYQLFGEANASTFMIRKKA
jgi:hypothetical protein